MAYFLALLVGFILGILGGGGSILTVPILVYVMEINPIIATGYSLFIVGVSALVGAQRFISRGDIDFKIGLFFAIPSVLGVFICRKWIVPSLPDVIHFSNFFSFYKETFILLCFGIIMLLASLSMLFSWETNSKRIKKNNYFMIAFDGAIVGVVTGLVGAGGGFLIVPALLLISSIEIKKAVGTSLLIIALKSLIGFLPEISDLIDWSVLLTFTIFSVLGILLGTYISKFIKASNLKRSFGIFVLLMSLFIMIKEMFY